LETKRYIIVGSFLTAVAVLTGVACRGQRNGVSVQNEEPDTGRILVSSIPMNDSKAAAQLVSGFYGVENNAWRWTAGKFSVLLRTPLTAAQRGATLTLAFTTPEVAIRKFGNITITASINGTTLTSAKYSVAGPSVFSADVSGSLLGAESVKVDFVLDKSLPPAGGDLRELGIVANSVSISPK
jgi:hypothetical protein